MKEVSGVRSLAVYFKREEAIIEVDEAISLERFQSALPEKYIMTAQSSTTMTENHVQSALDEQVSKGKQLLLLFVIFGYIVGASVLRHIQSWNWK